MMAQEQQRSVSILKLLSTLTPSSPARAWQSAPHPSHPFIATACADKTTRIYSLTSFTQLSVITGGHKRSVRCCAWRPTLPLSSGKKQESVLATGSFDATAAIWVGHPSRDAGGDDDGVEHDDLEDDDEDERDDFRFAVVLEGHDSEIKSIAWSAHGNFLATCSRDKSVWIWEALDNGIGGDGLGGADDEDNYETVAVMQEHDGDVKCIAWHPTDEGCLASASYDEQLRVWREDIDGEWTCVAVCQGHTGTVWCAAWEPWGGAAEDGGVRQIDEGPQSGPRLVSCSDDLSIRLWRRTPKERAPAANGAHVPSIIRSSSDEEEWTEVGKLPQRHERAIYAVAWSKTSKRIVSCGSDGKIIVYQEEPDSTNGESTDSSGTIESVWVVVAEIESSHGVFEVNHVCWAPRADRGKRGDADEVIVSTGDDGEVKVWIVEVG